MARTPLLRSLKSLFSEDRAARAAGLPLHGLRDLRAEARERERVRGVGPTRRQILAGAGATAAALAVPRVARAGGSPSIAVVGGGIAGLTCALKLADRGLASTVYEASGRIGGRMFSNTSGYFASSQVTEWCGELIDTGHTTVRKLAHRFDLPLDDLLAAQPEGSQDTYRFFGAYYPKATADDDFEPVFDAVSADEAAAPFPTLFDDFTTAGLELSNMSVYDWIESRVPGGHGSAMGQLLDVAYAIEYGADSTLQSALNLIYLLAFQPNPHSLAVFGESDERFHIRGGNQRLPEAIAASLGPAVKTGYKLVKIKQTAGGRYRLTFERGSGTCDVTVDWVVLAIPFAILRGIDYASAGFDELKDEAIQNLGRGHNGKLQLQFTNRLWTGTGPWPGKGNGSTYADTGYQASWEATRAQAGAPGILVLYSGGSVTDAMSSTTAFATAADAKVRTDVNRGLTQIEPVFPGLTARYSSKATEALPHKSSFFNASYAFYKTGQYTEFAGYEAARQGGVLFCGEHTSIDFQGFMEGGASEGKRAARQLDHLITGADVDAGF
jgi:monoamine oxidase